MFDNKNSGSKGGLWFANMILSRRSLSLLPLLLVLSWSVISIFVDAVEEGETCVGADGTVGECNDISSNDPEGLYYGEDLGVKQVMDLSRTADIQVTLKNAKQYLETTIFPNKEYRRLVEECKNKHESCAFWATLGECQNNPGYMNVSCAPVCQSCEYIMIETRCPLNKSDIDAWYSGDLHKMFERITTQPEFAQYEPKVFSRPDLLPGDTQATAPYLIGPWVVTLENVVTEEEAVRLIELGAVEGYERSADVGELKFDGTFDSFVNEGRTSTNAWCQNACYADPTAKRVMERIQNITNTPEPNSEFLQLLRYEEGQFYQQHHDYIGHQRERQEGVRILTVFLYLNDVEEGGGTNFPKLNLTVLPKRGRALLWPSVLNEDPNAQDPRTDHQALPVIKGIKYGANAWVHQRDFKTPNKNGCS